MRSVVSLFGWAGVLLVAGIGAALGGWMTQGSYPFQVHSRKVLTPEVKPGDDVEVEIEGYRTSRCPVVAYRIVDYPNGQRSPVTRDYPQEFGKLGFDKFRIRIPTERTQAFGPGSVYSYAESRCNPWEYLFPKSSGDPWVDQFKFAENTRHVRPEDVKPNPQFERVE
jgi:hypothetical protein